jgi:BirA family biotin operon repressor/biotin-[acetyl-CoA-carboxylase] ligase
VTAGPYATTSSALGDTAFSSIEYRSETESTNADAAGMLASARTAGHTIVAGYQHRGMGRKGRSWEAGPNGALLFTTILPGELEARHLWLVPFWTALAVHDALRSAGIATLLQWPNDILLGGGKLAGILCISQVTGDRARAACGIGLNVRRGLREIAGAAYCDDVAAVDEPTLLKAILRRFDEMLPLLQECDDVVARWEIAAGIPGTRYRIALDQAPEPFDAAALALELGGALRVQHDDCTIQRVDMADARVLR